MKDSLKLHINNLDKSNDLVLSFLNKIKLVKNYTFLVKNIKEKNEFYNKIKVLYNISKLHLEGKKVKLIKKDYEEITNELDKNINNFLFKNTKENIDKINQMKLDFIKHGVNKLLREKNYEDIGNLTGKRINLNEYKDNLDFIIRGNEYLILDILNIHDIDDKDLNYNMLNEKSYIITQEKYNKIYNLIIDFQYNLNNIKEDLERNKRYDQVTFFKNTKFGLEEILNKIFNIIQEDLISIINEKQTSMNL